MKFIHIFLLTALVTGLVHAQEADTLAYLKHNSDPVQRVYSKALLGFALEHKCNLLTSSVRAGYERDLNFATEIFNGYLSAKGIVQNTVQASNYSKSMALGTIRFAATSKCGSDVNEQVNTGLKTAQDFRSLIDGELRKKAD